MFKTSLRCGVWALATLSAFAVRGPAAGQTYITFHVGYSNDNTIAYAINAGGTVTGCDCGSDFSHGFVRASDGTIATFQAPNSLDTYPVAINCKGAIAGFGDYDSFVRKPGGKIISFNAGGYTNSFGINDSGVITGNYFDQSQIYHGFLRAVDGTITTFDLNGSTNTWATAINANGDTAGFYEDASNNEHGFLRMADGTTTSFDVPNEKYTQAWNINRKDAIVGCYGDPFTAGCPSATGGFERKPGGKIKTFALDGASQTSAFGINDRGQITGYYTSKYLQHGFVGSPKSGFVSFDVPNGNGTLPLSINNDGVITGAYYDANGILNGFLRIP